MADFQRSLKFVKSDQIEGGYQKMSQDRGNYNSRGVLVGTNMGISAPVLEKFLRWPPNEQAMRDLTSEEASAIYLVDFWMPIMGSSIRSQAVATVIFDGAVNHGVVGMTRMVQKAAIAGVDGIFGPNTLAAVNSKEEKALCERIIEQRRVFYERIIDRNQSQQVFRNGWMNRLVHLSDEISQLYGDK